jgi:hypothetical protein
MLDSTLVDVGIGVALVFFVVASTISVANQWLTRVLDIRAKVLWQALGNLVNNHGGSSFTIRTRQAFTGFVWSDTRPAMPGARRNRHELPTVAERLADTSLINALGGTRTWLPSNRTRVDKIGSETFTAALLELVDLSPYHEIRWLYRETERALERALDERASVADVVEGWTLARDPGRLKMLLHQIGGSVESAGPVTEVANAWRLAAKADAVASAAEDDDPATSAATSAAAEANRLRGEAIAAARELGPIRPRLNEEEVDLAEATLHQLRELVKGSPLEQVIVGAAARADARLDEVLTQVSRWFDETMDRLSDLYRNMARQVLFVAGFLVAIAMNLSAIDLVDDLQTNADARDELTATAMAACDSEATEEGCLAALSAQLTLPLVGEYQPPWEALGWGVCDPDEPGAGCEPDPTRDVDSRFEVIAGWLITGFAVSFGAPFWFDVAQRLVSFRRSNR